MPVDSWPEHVKKWWRDVWRHPVSSEWDTVADAAVARRLGDLYALLEASPTASLHAQAAKCEASLLLTPQSRRSAYVVLPDEDEPSPAQPGAVVYPAAGLTPERWMRAGQVNGWDKDDPRRLLAEPDPRDLLFED